MCFLSHSNQINFTFEKIEFSMVVSVSECLFLLFILFAAIKNTFILLKAYFLSLVETWNWRYYQRPSSVLIHDEVLQK